MSTELKQLDSPFIIANLDIDVYHRSEGISASGISLLMDCPKRYWHEYLNPEGKRDTSKSNDKFKLGSAVHMKVTFRCSVKARQQGDEGKPRTWP